MAPKPSIQCCCLVAQSCPTLCDPWTVAYHAPLSMVYSRQEYWNGLPFLSPRDLPNPGIEFTSPALAGGFLITQPPGKPHQYHKACQHQKTCEDTKTASENAINNEGRDYQDAEHMYNHG